MAEIDAAIDAGSSGTPPSADDDALLATRAVIAVHLGHLASAEQGAVAGDVEAVHDLRVATRRLRAALRLFEPLLPKPLADGARRELRRLAKAVGAVRDLDVLGETMRARAVRLDPELRAGLGPLAVAIHDQHLAAVTALAKVLDSSPWRRTRERLVAFTRSTAASRRRERLGSIAARLVQPPLRSARRAGHRLTLGSPASEFHRVRIRVKRLRYVLETMRGVGGRSVEKLVARLRSIQDILGIHQDATVAVAWLRAYAARPGVEAAVLLPVGAVIQALRKRSQKAQRRALEAWWKLERARLFEDVLAGLSDDAAAERGVTPRRRVGA